MRALLAALLLTPSLAGMSPAEALLGLGPPLEDPHEHPLARPGEFDRLDAECALANARLIVEACFPRVESAVKLALESMIKGKRSAKRLQSSAPDPAMRPDPCLAAAVVADDV